MKTLVICESVHHGNTQKIAQAMAWELEAEVKRAEEVDPAELGPYDLIGFGSGIYFAKHHGAIFELLSRLEGLNKKVFVFSTAAVLFTPFFHRAIKKRLREVGGDIVGEFSCVGYDTYCIPKPVGGIHKGRPNQEDIANARDFARSLGGVG